MDIPESFYDPITKQVMTDPFITNLGISYDKRSIEQWLQQSDKCPVTGTHLTLEMLKPNRALKDTIQTVLQSIGNNYKTVLVKKEESELILVKKYFNNNLLFSIVPSDKNTREPCEICLVIDTSGSMSTNVTIQNESGKRETYNLSILDLVKHATKTIINTMEDYDKLTIISYSTEATIVLESCLMSIEGKKKAIGLLESLQASGQTNLWDGLHKGLELLSEVDNKNNSVFILTDGQPNLIPPRGHIPMLQKYKDEHKNMSCSINTFAFGYEADSDLLVKIAKECNGNYNFIPDSGFVGTVFVHALANFLTTKFTNVKLQIELDSSVDKDNIDVPYNFTKTSWGLDIDLGSIRYGQSKDIVLPISLNEDQLSKVNIQLIYKDVFKSELTKVNDSVITIGNDIKIIRNLARQNVVSLINMILKNNNSQVSMSIIINLIEAIKKEKVEDEYLNYLLEDLSGQITEAVSRNDWYNRWGKHYLPSIMMAHLEQLCNNFKDPGIQNYGGKLFKKIRDDADKIFCDMPPPKPSVQRSYGHYRSAPGAVGSSSPVNMTVFSQSSGPCISGDCEVLLSNNKTKLACEIKKDDYVKTPSGTAKVLCVTKTACINGKTILVQLHNGLKITPYHPLRYNCEWKFPINIQEEYENMKEYEVDYIFNYVLEKDHIMIVNGYEYVTLGHGFEENDVIRHPYYGTQAVIDDLKKSDSWNHGLVIIDPLGTKRDPNTNMVCELNCV